MDEIFIGGKQSREELREKGSNKTPYLIMVEERNGGGPGFLSFEELGRICEEDVLPALEKNIARNSVIKSDGKNIYAQTKRIGYKNESVVAMKDPEKGHDHLKWTNLITSNLKRFLLSTHHGTHPQYRKYYLAEFAYRFNRRFWSGQVFDRLLYACVMANPAPKKSMQK